MDLHEAIETNGTCRFFRPDPIPRERLLRALSAARFAPSGGNRQPVSFVVVTDADLRRELAAMYLIRWKAYAAAVSGANARVPAIMRNADHFANHLAEVPAQVVVCARIADCYATDTALGRLSVVGGASIYPAVQNFLLGCRAEGLGTALTTLLVADEAKLRRLLALPEAICTAAFIAVGFPAKPFPRRLRRRELAEMSFANRYGTPL